MRRSSAKRRALIAFAALYVGALLALPVLTLLRSAFARGVTGFVRALAAPDAQHALLMTAELTAFAVVVNVVFGTIVAILLVRDARLPLRRFWNGLIDVPFAMSPVIVGFVLIEMFGNHGLLTPLTDALHVKVAFAWPGMAIATTLVSLPFVVRELVPVLEELGTDQEKSAYTLGASAFTTFRRVTLPSLRWAIFYGVTLTAARAMGEFGAVLVISGGVAGKTETATSFIYRALEDRNDVGAHAVALVLAALSIALLLAMDAMKKRRASAAERS